jgi:hypothetical protein
MWRALFGRRSIPFLFRRCPVAISAKRGANRAGHLGRRLNCALESSSVNEPSITFRFPAENKLIPFHCAVISGTNEAISEKWDIQTDRLPSTCLKVRVYSLKQILSRPTLRRTFESNFRRS